MGNKSELPPRKRHKNLEEIEAEMEILREQYLESRDFKNETEFRKALKDWRAAVENLLKENSENRPEDSRLKKVFDSLFGMFANKRISGRDFADELTMLLGEPLTKEEKRDHKKIN